MRYFSPGKLFEVANYLLSFVSLGCGRGKSGFISSNHITGKGYNNSAVGRVRRNCNNTRFVLKKLAV
jgi:hypothetical protein